MSSVVHQWSVTILIVLSVQIRTLVLCVDGFAMETTTAETRPMRTVFSAILSHVKTINSDAQVIINVSRSVGSATAIKTARTERMSLRALVALEITLVRLVCLNVTREDVLIEDSYVMDIGTVQMAAMRTKRDIGV